MSWLGAVQAQDYAGGKWAIGLRLDGATSATVERAILDRTIVRTWPMRGTLHFVAAADVRWMLALLAARPLARAAGRHRQLELDDAVFASARRVIEKRMRGGGQLTRAAAYRALNDAGIETAGQRGIHILARLAHEALVVFGAGEGLRQTVALLDEWVPPAPAWDRDAALAELARRYFRSHGPATTRDFAWWSGLSQSDARVAVDLMKDDLECDIVSGAAYWHAGTSGRRRSGGAYLLPPFDEYLVAYRDRSAALAPADAPRVHALLSPTIVVGSRVAGTWGRRFERRGVTITMELFWPVGSSSRRAIDAAARVYARYAGVPLLPARAAAADS